jgi:hypothetical protein
MSLLRNTPLKTTLDVENLVFAVYVRSYTSPITQSRFPVLLKSFVPTWITIGSGLLRSLYTIPLCICSVLMPGKHSTFTSEHIVPTLLKVGSPKTKHSPHLGCPCTFSRLLASLSAVASPSCSSSVLVILVRASICCKASCSFSSSSLSLSDLHLSQNQFPL